MRRLGQGALGGQAPVLPLAGGYMDQPAAMMDAFELFDAWAAQRKGGDGE